MSTRLQIRNALKLRIPRSTAAGGDISDAQYDSWIDDGLLDLATRRMQLRSLEGAPTTVALSAGTYQYLIPTSTPTIFAITDLAIPSVGVVLQYWNGTFNTMLQALIGVGAANAQPSQYIVRGAYFYVFPTPDTSYTAYLYPYYRPSFSVAGDSGIPTIEEEWHYAIQLIAIAHAWRDLGDDERAQGAENDFMAWLNLRDTPVKANTRYASPKMRVKMHSYLTRGSQGA